MGGKGKHSRTTRLERSRFLLSGNGRSLASKLLVFTQSCNKNQSGLWKLDGEALRELLCELSSKLPHVLLTQSLKLLLKFHQLTAFIPCNIIRFQAKWRSWTLVCVHYHKKFSRTRRHRKHFMTLSFARLCCYLSKRGISKQRNKIIILHCVPE